MNILFVWFRTAVGHLELGFELEDRGLEGLEVDLNEGLAVRELWNGEEKDGFPVYNDLLRIVLSLQSIFPSVRTFKSIAARQFSRDYWM